MSLLNEDIREKFHNLAVEDKADFGREPVISIGTAPAKVGLPVSPLRKYEKEGLLIYHRTATARRPLSRADIRRIPILQHIINDPALDIEGKRRLRALLPCWRLKLCSDSDKQACRAVADSIQPCWMDKESEWAKQGIKCRSGSVYRFDAYCTEILKSLLHNLDHDSEHSL